MKKIFHALLICTFILQNVIAKKETIIKGEEFYLNVAQEYINELEEYGLCNFQLEDFNYTITATKYSDFNVEGTVYYTKGFIGTMQEAETVDSRQPGTIDEDSMRFAIDVTMKSLIIYFDFFADITDGPVRGTVAIPVDKVKLVLEIIKYFDKRPTKHEVIYKDDTIANHTWRYEPPNEYTDIINREVSHSFSDLLEILAKNQLTERLVWVLKKVPLPEFCIYC